MSILIRPIVFAVGLLLAMPLVVGATEADLRKLFSSLDANENGQLATNEIRPEHSALFTRLLRTADADNDGQLAIAEFVDGLQPERSAKPLAEKQSSKLPGADALLLLLSKMDGNGDQRIVVEEVPEEYVAFFARMEERLGGKKDGRIDRRELIQAAPKLCQLAKRYAEQQGLDVQTELARLPKQKRYALDRMDKPRRPYEMLSDPQQAKRLFAELDVDNDGQMTAEEISEPFAQIFNRLLAQNDRNKDGQLSKKEFLAVSRRMAANKKGGPADKKVEKEVARMLGRFDDNDDQQLSVEEAPKRMADRFDRIDSNGDGSLDKQELQRMVKLLSRLRGAEKKSDPKVKPQQ